MTNQSPPTAEDLEAAAEVLNEAMFEPAAQTADTYTKNMSAEGADDNPLMSMVSRYYVAHYGFPATHETLSHYAVYVLAIHALVKPMINELTAQVQEAEQ